MNTSTIAPVLPEIDIEQGNEIADDILLESARTEKVAKVKGGSTRTAIQQSHQARAWTAAGNVD
jgi:hypothetical protein